MQHLPHPASVDAYIRHGWSLVAIAPGTKLPATDEWGLKKNALVSQDFLPTGYGIGLAHAYSGTMALDIDDWDRAAFELMLHGINLQSYYDAPDAVIIDSGRKGHGKLLYSMPFGVALPSKKLIDKKSDGKHYNYLDFRCGTANGLTVQDVLPPSIHPDTGQPYRWAGRGHWSRLPPIPMPLLDFWMSLINTKHSTAPVEVDASWDEIKEMLNHIPPDVSRQEWIHCGMAIHWVESQLGQIGAGFPIWNSWSAGGYKYPGEKEVRNQWSSFSADKDVTITLGTLKTIARDHGWKPPLPDVTALFGDVKPQPPDEVQASLVPPAPRCPLEPFPTLLQNRANEVAVSVGCDPVIPLLAGMSTVCAAIDARTRLKLADGWKVPPVLWLMTIGEPAGKKTPGSTPMFDILTQLEHEDRPNFNKRHLEWQGAEASHAAAMKAFREYCASPEYMLGGDGAPPVPSLPDEPQPLRLAITDITSQDMVRKAAVRPYGMLMYRDELSSWFGQLTDSRSGVDRSSWTVSYEAKPYHMDRVGSGHIYAENLAISVYGNIQPDALSAHIHKLCEDGFMQRFIPGVLPRAKWKRGKPIPDALSSREKWENMIRMVHALPIMEYSLSEGAHQSFYDFQTWFGAQQDDAQLLNLPAAYRTALGKGDGTLGRLALIFHVMEAPFSLQISKDTMDRAAAFMKDYVIPALYHVLGEYTGANTTDKWVMDHIIQHADQGHITLKVLKEKYRGIQAAQGLPPWQQSQALLIAMDHLEQAGWVRRSDDRTMEHRDIFEWVIADLGAHFADKRKETILAKQRLQDLIWSKSGKPAPRVHGFE